MKKIAFSLAALTAAVSASTASALVLFEDGLDATTNFAIQQDADATLQVVDYGAGFSVPNPLGAPVVRTHPEAPRTVPGSGATTGVMITANDTGFPGGSGAAATASLISNATFSGDYQYSYDMYLSIGNGTTEFFPTAGETEIGLGAVGRNNTTSQNGWAGRATGDGVNTWLTTENGFGSADAGLWNDNVEILRRGDTRASAEGPTYNADVLWNVAFADPNGSNFGVNQTPANVWVEVDIAVKDQNNGNSRVEVYYNGVRWFSRLVTNADVAGAVSFGYQDPFGSINDQPDYQYGLFDNIRVSDTITVPEPASMALMGLGGLMMLRRRR
jgi:PEP-CTERM motif-containing protein